ncbi:hypothetical protein CRN76_10705 [Chryseobacterium indologenes]|uniref:hypothetical protein n=1 Tax=Chryseobacterium indologenes TaxID=253 RepID=UPI000BFD75DC|nr:hypothetical protein [Chryseobacterium indologenes]ATN05833.1 hypothetical protein CRN76_10705 [Chryseobacterium indologenes]
MIKIQDHISKPNPERFVLNLAKKHWKNQNPKLKNRIDYKESSLIKKCNKYYSLTNQHEYIQDFANGSQTEAKRHRKFFKYLIKEKNKKLKQLIIGMPNELNSLKSEISQILNNSDIYNIIDGKPTLTKFGNLLLDKVFNYKKFRSDNFCKEIFLELDFSNSTCPYCNENLLKITQIRSNSTQDTLNKAYLDIDHFFSKVYYPYFGISFFNLIPSCHGCNSSDKRDLEFNINTHIHPYVDSFDEHYTFKISLVALLGDTVDELKIISQNKRIGDKTTTDIKLPERYANNFERANNLINLFTKHKHNIGTPNESTFKELMLKDVPPLKHNILRFERAKMNRDILKQVDIHSFLNID